MDKILFQQIKSELVNGSVKKGHPFKYFTLGTLLNGIPQQRTVVLRKVQENLDLLFYTDKRSAKVAQIKENPHVSALFYHPKKLLQIQLQGKATVKENPELLRKIWKTIPEKMQRDYRTVLPPGVPTDAPEAIEYLSDHHHFCMIELEPNTLSYLKLNRPHHLRVRYTRHQNDWEGTFLIP